MAKRNSERDWESYEKQIKSHKEDGYKEKKAAIDKLTTELEQLEASLLAAGAKTFKELYPEIPEPQQNSHNNNPYKQPGPAPYTTDLFKFQVPDLNQVKKTGYLKIFGAAWNDDLETLKSLTLAPWEHQAGEPLAAPLQIAVQDGNGFSPFSIAVFRGHYKLAHQIIGIASAQLDITDESRSHQRWTLNSGDSDDDSDGNEDDSGALPIYSELVNDKYTIDNLGQVSTAVKSQVAPLTMIEWPCYARRFLDPSKENDRHYTILSHAVSQDDIKLFKFIMQLGTEQQSLLAEEEDDQKCYTVSQDIFYKAIKLGRTAMLAEMVCRSRNFCKYIMLLLC